MSYMDRAMKARDPRFARVLGKLGYQRSDMVADAKVADPLDHDSDGRKGGSPKQAEDLTALRAEYKEIFGKNAFNGWDAAKLREKIAEAKASA